MSVQNKSIKENEMNPSGVSLVMSLPRAYEDPHEPGALGGVKPFAQAHKLKTKQAQRVLQSVLTYTLHKPRRTRFPTTPTLVFDRDEQWQMDLVDMQKLSRWNKGNKYLLTVIDVLSKYAWAVPIQAKSSRSMIKGLEAIRRQSSPRWSFRVQTYQGKEFYNAGVQAWFKKHGTHHFSTYGDSKASVVERWHRTLKQRIYRYLTAHNTSRYVDVLQPLIDTYNQAYHRSIGMAPHQVTTQTVPEVWDRLYGPRLDQKTPPPKCQVGDRVRLNKKHRPFKKGYLPGWTEEVFVVTHVRHLSIERMGWHAHKRHVLRTGCAKSPSVGRFLIPSGKSLETEKRSGVGAVERVALQVRQLDPGSTQTWCASNKKRPVRKKSPGWTKYRPKPVDPGRVTRPRPPRTPRF